MSDDIGTVPEGWCVLYCHQCPCALSWTYEDAHSYGDADTWHDAMKWALDQLDHQDHVNVRSSA